MQGEVILVTDGAKWLARSLTGSVQQTLVFWSEVTAFGTPT
jgi:hypothetical protein